MMARKEKCTVADEIYALEHLEQRTLTDKFKRADECLSEQHQPESILCRDFEIEQIKKFIKEFLDTGHSKQSLYISGVPGIGKTLSVSRALADIEKDEQMRSAGRGKGKIRFVKLNAMKHLHPSDIYKNLYNELSYYDDFKKKKKISSYNALVTLDGIFRNHEIIPEDEHILTIKKVVVIDEIDYLKTRDEEVLYNIFDWTQSQNSRLAVIAISNTINFPQVLKSKILSRIGNRRLIFKPYSNAQLQKILNQRVEQTQVFDKNVINFVCKKIAKCSSDIRKCFQILREAILLHTKSNYDSQNFKIKSDTVTKAYDAVYRDHFTDIYSSMPKNFKIILSFLAEYAKNGTRLMSIETACSILKSKYHFHEGNAKEFLIALMGMGVVEIKHTISETSKTRYLKEFNVRLAIDIQKMNYAHQKYGLEE